MKKHGRYLYVVVGGVASVVTIVGWAAPGLRAALGNFAWAGWTLAVALAAVAAWIWLAKDDALVEQNRTAVTEAQKSQNDANAAKARLEQRVADLEGELGSARAALDDAKQRLHPTDRDRALFTQVLDLLPYGEGAMPFLDQSFNAKRWREQSVAPIFELAGAWKHRFFDDADVQTAFERLRVACKALARWLAQEGAPAERAKAVEGDLTYDINPADARAGGYEEFAATRQEAFQLADEVLAARKDFEQVGRRRGL